MEDIASFTLDDLKTYYRTFYYPGNAFIVAVGDFRTAELLERIEKSFGSIPGGKSLKEVRFREEPQAGERRLTVRKEAELPYLTVAYHVPNLRDPESYVLEVIAKILSEGKSSRLYEKLVREKRLALAAGADNPLLSKDPRGLQYLGGAHERQRDRRG